MARRPAGAELSVEHAARRPSAADAPHAPAAREGTFAQRSERAAAMEQIATLAATALRAPLAFVALIGGDGERACYVAGEDVLPWTIRDEEAFWSSGLVELVSAGPVELRDLTRNHPIEQLRRFAGLRIGSLLGAPIRSASDHLYGVICAAYPQPTIWNDDDADMLQQFARMAASDLELRRVVEEQAEREQRLAFDVDHDPLTGLSTRAVLLERLRAALERPPMHDDAVATRSRAARDDAVQIPSEDLVAVFYLDIDDFRAVNERYGHRVGDRMLATVGRRLQRAAGDGATVARLAGVQFAVLVERMESAEAVDELEEDLRSAVAQPISVGTEQVTLDVSVGAVWSATTARLAEHLLHGADHAMARGRKPPIEAEVPIPTVTPSDSGPTEPQPVESQAAEHHAQPGDTREQASAGSASAPSAGSASAPTPLRSPEQHRPNVLPSYRPTRIRTRLRRMWRHLAGMIHEAAEYAKVDARMVRFSVDRVPLEPVLDELRDEIVPDVYERGVRYRPAPIAMDLAVRADPVKLRKVLRQLVSNAVKFTPAGGEVAIDVEPVGPVVHIHVRDMGPGIPAQQLGRIFDPYLAVNRKALAWTDRGLGLGLAISRRYAEGMAGAIHVESTVGVGSTFTLTILRA